MKKENIEEKQTEKRSCKRSKEKKANNEVNAEENGVEKEVENDDQQEFAEVLKRADEFEKKYAEASDKYVRMVAEFDNYRRRTSKEKLELINSAEESIITGMLPILDDCELALRALKDSNADTSAIEGTELILSKLFNYLKSRGVEKIEAVGKALDTDFHEAIAQFPVEDSEKKNIVIDVAQNGYILRGKVIRYAKVVVGA